MSKIIQLKSGCQAIIDDEDFDLVNQFKWHIAGRGYAYYNNRKQRGSMHRLVMHAKKGDCIDHINENKLDNRKCNLRFCTHSTNLQRRTNLSKPLRGIEERSNGKFRVRIYKNRKAIHLGMFDKKEDAIEAYNRAVGDLYDNYAFKITTLKESV